MKAQCSLDGRHCQGFGPEHEQRHRELSRRKQQSMLMPRFDSKALTPVQREMLEEADVFLNRIETSATTGAKDGRRLSADSLQKIDAIRQRLSVAHSAHAGAADHLAAALDGIEALVGTDGAVDPPQREDDDAAAPGKGAPDLGPPGTVHCEHCGSTRHLSQECPRPSTKSSVWDWLVPKQLRG